MIIKEINKKNVDLKLHRKRRSVSSNAVLIRTLSPLRDAATPWRFSGWGVMPRGCGDAAASARRRQRPAAGPNEIPVAGARPLCGDNRHCNRRAIAAGSTSIVPSSLLAAYGREKSRATVIDI